MRLPVSTSRDPRPPKSGRPTFGDVTAPAPLYLPVSFVVLGLVTFLALVILMIGARSPYTHANLAAGFDPRYERTSQILVSTDTAFMGLSRHAESAGADQVTRGAVLYVTAGCASCHALEARGGPVGPRIGGADLATVMKRVRQGPLGMPRFSAAGLTDEQLSDIATYLQSLPRD